MTEQTAAAPPAAPTVPIPTPPSYAALHARGTSMPFAEFERRILTVWRDKQRADKGEPAPDEPMFYPHNEELCGFKLLSPGRAEMVLTVAENARMGVNEKAKFIIWTAGLSVAADEIARLEGLV